MRVFRSNKLQTQKLITFKKWKSIESKKKKKKKIIHSFISSINIINSISWFEILIRARYINFYSFANHLIIHTINSDQFGDLLVIVINSLTILRAFICVKWWKFRFRRSEGWSRKVVADTSILGESCGADRVTERP